MLKGAGIPIWRDRDNLLPGDNLRAKIRSAINQDAVFIACLSSHGAARKIHQNEELLLAIDHLRRRHSDAARLIPVRFDDCDIPDIELGAGRTLASIPPIDLFGADREPTARRLVEEVERLLR
jgi:hypothetical protein